MPGSVAAASNIAAGKAFANGAKLIEIIERTERICILMLCNEW
jgi:hypothetical protein